LAIARRVVPALALVALTLAVYWPAVGAGTIWDDDSYLTENPTLTEPGGLRAIWLDRKASPQYYPLVFTSFWLERRLWGEDPAGYHVVNVLLHAGAALVLWRVLRRLGTPGAWLAAALFAVHPVHVESVAWITERKNVLSGLCYLVAALCYCRFEGFGAKSAGGEPGTRPANRWLLYAAAAALFGCALLSKSVTASFPAAVAVGLWWRKGRIGRGDVARLAPLLALGAAAGLATAGLEQQHVGAEGAAWSFSFAERVLIAGRALWFYAGKLVVPSDLTFFYPLWPIDAGAWSQYLYPTAFVALTAALWGARRRLGRGPLAALLFFAGTLFPALGFVSFYPMRFAFVADHFQYLASIGVLVPLAALLTTGFRASPWRALAWAGPLALAALLTWRQAHDYTDAETLWRATLTRNPRAFAAHSELGLIETRRGDLGAAQQHFETALTIKPDYYEAWNNLGLVSARRGDLEQAIGHYRASLEHSPDYVPALVNLGIAYYQNHQVEAAIETLRSARALVPDGPQILLNLGAILALRGAVDEAAELLDRAAELGFMRAESQRALAEALLEQRRFAAAAMYFQRAARLDPGDSIAHNGAGVALARLGRPDQALEHFQAALRLEPTNVDYSRNVRTARRAVERGEPGGG